MRIKINQSNVAIFTGPAVTAGDWFIFDINNGGYYGDGEREGVDNWVELDVPEDTTPTPEPEPEPEPEGEL
ncbi:hypothetical protein ACEWX3_07675 [Mycobacterium sp. G7A2]|uniref:hypothetical protein n=1 Tax=Mycobacterium sp. G7A2 TaxID=3317307 RepID=UPI0035A94512